MRIGIIGAGRIGGGIARALGASGHEVKLSFSRDRGSLESLAGEIGPAASMGTPRRSRRVRRRRGVLGALERPA